MGSDPADERVNRYLQSWDVPNLFVMGASRLPAERRLQPDRHGGRPGLLGGRRDQDAISEESRPAGAGVRSIDAMRRLSICHSRPGVARPALRRCLRLPQRRPRSRRSQRGKYLVDAGDCVACHTAEHGKPFAGGRPIETPFGIIYSRQHHARPGDRHRRLVGRGFLPRDARGHRSRTASGSIRRFPIPISPRSRARMC